MSDLVALTTEAYMEVTTMLGRSKLMGYAKAQAALKYVRRWAWGVGVALGYGERGVGGCA
jgi:hypothetical protein